MNEAHEHCRAVEAFSGRRLPLKLQRNPLPHHAPQAGWHRGVQGCGNSRKAFPPDPVPTGKESLSPRDAGKHLVSQGKAPKPGRACVQNYLEINTGPSQS